MKNDLARVDLLSVTGGAVRAPAYSNQPIVWRNGYASELPLAGPTFPSGPHYKTNPYLNLHTVYPARRPQVKPQYIRDYRPGYGGSLRRVW